MSEGMEYYRDPVQESPQHMERDVLQYETFLGIDAQNLHGERVLNIGSGLTGKFEKLLAAKGVDVLTASPYFAARGVGGETMRSEYNEGTFHSLKRKFINTDEKWPDAIAAWAEDLPLKDESVDLLLALYSVPLYTDKEDYNKLFSELTRVLKEGGTAKLYPISQEMLEKISPILEALPVRFTTESTLEESDMVFPNEVPVRLEFTRVMR